MSRTLASSESSRTLPWKGLKATLRSRRATPWRRRTVWRARMARGGRARRRRCHRSPSSRVFLQGPRLMLATALPPPTTDLMSPPPSRASPLRARPCRDMAGRGVTAKGRPRPSLRACRVPPARTWSRVPRRRRRWAARPRSLSRRPRPRTPTLATAWRGRWGTRVRRRPPPSRAALQRARLCRGTAGCPPAAERARSQPQRSSRASLRGVPPPRPVAAATAAAGQGWRPGSQCSRAGRRSRGRTHGPGSRSATRSTRPTRTEGRQGRRCPRLASDLSGAWERGPPSPARRPWHLTVPGGRCTKRLPWHPAKADSHGRHQPLMKPCLGLLAPSPLPAPTALVPGGPNPPEVACRLVQVCSALSASDWPYGA
mmetsp:Transcript_142400/g.442797  ORF Transcript_142400/g.442797 Transcript_142400/m.442797 type:complete len:371 (-) Transcript_142400:70-1182(-)